MEIELGGELRLHQGMGHQPFALNLMACLTLRSRDGFLHVKLWLARFRLIQECWRAAKVYKELHPEASLVTFSWEWVRGNWKSANPKVTPLYASS